MEEVDDYDATLNWAIQEETLRTTRGQGYGSFYLILVSILILMFCFLVVYYSNRNRANGTSGVNKGKDSKDITALDLIKDENNILLEEFSNVEDDDIEEEDDDEEPENKETI